jgi:sugar O-acyltransferase (sialic acid O-acetyltransferase NeuD family)
MQNENQPVFIFGAGGHAKVLIDIVEKSGVFSLSFLVDDDPLLKGTAFLGYPVIGGKKELTALERRVECALIAIGNNAARCAVGQWLQANGYTLISAAHPSSQIGRAVEIGAGTVLMANTVVNPSSKVGDNVIINTGATVDHDCVIGDGVHIAPGATVCGTVKVGKKSFIGAGSTVINNITIGKNVFIGAGTTIYSDVSDGTRIVGPRSNL